MGPTAGYRAQRNFLDLVRHYKLIFTVCLMFLFSKCLYLVQLHCCLSMTMCREYVCGNSFTDGGEKRKRRCVEIWAHFKQLQVVKPNPAPSTTACLIAQVYSFGAFRSLFRSVPYVDMRRVCNHGSDTTNLFFRLVRRLSRFTLHVLSHTCLYETRSASVIVPFAELSH